MHKLACSLVCALMVSSVQAEDTQKSSNVVKLWQSFEKLAKEATKARTAAIQKVRKALQEGKNQQEAIAEYRKEMAKIMGPATKAREAFLEAFGKSDWTSFKGKEHAQMLQAALPGVGQNALSKGKFDQALKAYQALVKLAPKSPSSLRAQLTIGDLLAIQGEVEKAREAYEVVADSDNRTYKRYAAQRLLIGKDAPELKTETWIGAKAQKLSQLHGKVVVLDFWATWCGPCRAVMPDLSKLYDKYKKDGLVILGVTHFYSNGYLPANPKQMLSGGKRVQKMDEKEYVKHVTAFRDNTKISYPFVIGANSNFSDYGVLGIPSVAVIDTKGKIALLTVGSGSEPLIKAVVERELKKGGK